MAALTTGFTWGSSRVDNCDEAKQLAYGITSTSDRSSRSEAEASIRQICPDGAAGIFIKGLAYEVAGNTEQALLSYKETLKVDSHFSPANGRIGLIYLAKTRDDEAAVELTKASRSHQDPLYDKGLARIFTAKKLYPLALFHYQEAIRSLPADATLFTDIARTYGEAGDPLKAEESYRRAMALSPGDRTAFTGLAAIYRTSGQYDKALDILKKAEAAAPLDKDLHRLKAEIYQQRGDTSAANAEFRLAGIQSPAASGNGDAFFAAGEFAKAAEAYKIESRSDPENTELRQKLVNSLLASGRDDEAIATYREAARLHPENAEFRYNLGILYEKKGLHDEAVVEYKQTLKSSENVDVRYRLANIYTERGSLQQAIEQYRILLKGTPGDQELLLKLARAYTANGNVKDAVASLRDIVRLYPDRLEAHRELVTIYKKANQQDDLEKEYREIIRLKKDDMDVRNALTSIYVKKKNYAELVTLLKENVDMAPQDNTQHYKLGLVYEFQKNYADASASYLAAVKLKENNAKALNALGRINMKTGHIQEAKEYLEKAKAIDPGMEETALLLSNIRDELAPVTTKYKKSNKGKKSKKSRISKKSTKKSSIKKVKKPAAKAASGARQ